MTLIALVTIINNEHWLLKRVYGNNNDVIAPTHTHRIKSRFFLKFFGGFSHLFGSFRRNFINYWIFEKF
jgi:hypothetical protein